MLDELSRPFSGLTDLYVLASVSSFSGSSLGLLKKGRRRSSEAAGRGGTEDIYTPPPFTEREHLDRLADQMLAKFAANVANGYLLSYLGW